MNTTNLVTKIWMTSSSPIWLTPSMSKTIIILFTDPFTTILRTILCNFMVKIKLFHVIINSSIYIHTFPVSQFILWKISIKSEIIKNFIFVSIVSSNINYLMISREDMCINQSFFQYLIWRISIKREIIGFRYLFWYLTIE